PRCGQRAPAPAPRLCRTIGDQMPGSQFRRYLFPADHPRLAAVRGLDPYQYQQAAREDPFTGGLIKGWTPLYLNEFRGITEDGELQEGRHPLIAARAGEEAPVADMVQAATALLAAVD